MTKKKNKILANQEQVKFTIKKNKVSIDFSDPDNPFFEENNTPEFLNEIDGLINNLL